jgi:hypothetical protein
MYLAFGWPLSRSRLDSNAGGMNGIMTPDAMAAVVMAFWRKVSGRGAREEKWRTA